MTSLAPLDAYRLLAPEYAAWPNPLLALERRMLPPLLPSLSNILVVDAASGTGYWADYCAQHGARTIAADLCHEMLCAGRHERDRMTQADLRALPFRDNAADLTICAFALGYAPRSFSELARITRRGGFVIVSDVHPDGFRRGWTRSFRCRGQSIHIRHETYALDDLCAPGLQLDALLECHFGEPERAIFTGAGKLDEFDRAAAHPAVFVARWRRLLTR